MQPNTYLLCHSFLNNDLITRHNFPKNNKIFRHNFSNHDLLYQERAFIEQLFSTRFNYFLVAFSFLAAAVVQISSPCTQLIVLFISAMILTIMSLIIYRAYIKLIIILKMIYRLGDYHVFSMVDREVTALNNKISVPVNPLLGVVVPLLGTLVFWGCFIYSLICMLKGMSG